MAPARDWDRILVTGGNGAGKTHLARRLSRWLGDRRLHHADAWKLGRDWARRPADAVAASRAEAIGPDLWIIEGGPSHLTAEVLAPATLVIWLDPPGALRAWRLLLRPLRRPGRTRPELPPGNPDRILAQWRFGLSSLRREAAFRAALAEALEGWSGPVRRLRQRRDLERLLAEVAP